MMRDDNSYFSVIYKCRESSTIYLLQSTIPESDHRTIKYSAHNIKKLLFQQN